MEKLTLNQLIHKLNLYFNSIQNRVVDHGKHHGPSTIEEYKTDLEKLINDTLCQTNLDEINFYANSFLSSESLFLSILKNIISNDFGHKNDVICKWFYHWYNLNSIQTKKFVLLFLPAIIWIYLLRSSPNNLLTGIESCLIVIYNQELFKRDGKERVFNPPIPSIQSFIDKPDFQLQQQQQQLLTENTLKLLNSQSKSIILEKPLPKIESVTTQTKSLLLKTVFNIYVSALSTLPLHSKVIFCEMASRLPSNGYNFSNLSNSIPQSSAKSLDDSTYNELDGDESIPIPEPTTSTTTTTTTSTSTKSLDPNSRFNHLVGLTKFLIKGHKFDDKRIFLAEKIYQEIISGLTYCANQDSTREIAKVSALFIFERAKLDLIPELLLSTSSLLSIINKK